MQQELAPGFRLCRDRETGARWVECSIDGESLESTPILNKGTGFTQEERDAFGLTGLLPPRCVSMEEQRARIMRNYRAQTTDLERYSSLAALIDRSDPHDPIGAGGNLRATGRSL